VDPPKETPVISKDVPMAAVDRIERHGHQPQCGIFPDFLVIDFLAGEK
jgi:hypothetical protein